MIKGYVIGGRETVIKLKSLTGEIRKEVVKSVWRIVLRLQRYVKENKLSGQVLHVRTGTLRRSITATVSEQAFSIIGSVGTNVSYGRIHELGYQGPEQVKAHLREMKIAWGRPMKNPRKVEISAHVRQMNMPMRSFLLSSLKDLDPEIQREFQQALATAGRAFR